MNATDPGDRASRVEREILEILERADAAQSPVDNLQATVRRQSASARSKLAGSSPRAWMPRWATPQVVRIIVAFALAVAASLLGDVSRLVSIPLAIASAVVFFSLWFPGPQQRLNERPRWRGQDLDDPPGPPPIDFERFKRGPRRPSR